jgi:nicotinate dehydrogenase subunit B
MTPETFHALMAQDFKDNMELFPSANRREFMKRLGGGIFVFVALGEFAALAQDASQERGVRGRNATDFNAFLRIAEDGRITLFTGKICMGQGPVTSLPQELAEELDAPMSSIDIIMGDTDLCPHDGGTWGSMTTRQFGQSLRAAGAEARAVLLDLAAESLKVPKTQLVAEDGAIFDSQDKKNRVTYGQLAKGQSIARHIDGKAVLKEPANFKVMGKPVLRRDAREKVTGAAKYSGDIRVPGMLYASVLRPPAHGATLKSVDVTEAKKISGVQVVQEGNLVATLHEFPDVAQAALEKVKAEFDPSSSTLDNTNIHAHLLDAAPQSRSIASGGDLEAGKKLAAKMIEKTYFDSYIAHAPMETHTGLAQIEGDKCTVWASVQAPFGLQGEVARAIGFPQNKVRIITPYVGGAFGGKARNLQALDAARLAKITGKPVQVMASREDEFHFDTFRPAVAVKINSGIDASGNIVFWDYNVVAAGERGAAHFYNIPNHRTASGNARHPFDTGAWCAPGNSSNTFARESHIDSLAVAAGIDPVEFRRKNLSHPKLAAVLQTAVAKFGSTISKAPSKRGIGIALGADAGTFAGVIVEVAVDTNKGTVQVKRVVCVQDMGIVVNPEGARQQMEGCIMMGLGYSLTEEVHFKNGKILDTNFDSYEIPKFSWTPKMECHFIDSTAAPQGGGEPAVILMGAALANAVFDATGARLLQLPMTPERIKAALAKV